ncbi:MAG: hypothetical protein FJX16_00285 [Alphaproteobacteria bacterium]|nr:hypothetical protein [Alphaproteobacteria bacterium]MBM3623769.1 hypothetical protein [Alphaproteobacteria bacterium]
MGKVIAFQPRMKASPTRKGALERDAEILFFLGVRYVRMDDADQRTISEPKSCGAPPSGGKRRRRVRA